MPRVGSNKPVQRDQPLIRMPVLTRKVLRGKGLQEQDKSVVQALQQLNRYIERGVAPILQLGPQIFVIRLGRGLIFG